MAASQLTVEGDRDDSGRGAGSATRVRAVLFCTLAAFCLGMPAFAQDFPNGPVRVVVPFPPGGAADITARIVAQQLQQAWRQPVLVDNRPGAGSVIGTDAVAKAKPDGHTLGMVVAAYMVNPGLRPSLPYDTLKDFANVTQLVEQEVALVAHPRAPFSTLPEMIAYAKKNPGKITYASAGTGTAFHVALEQIGSETGISMVHVPYKGITQAEGDVIAGRVDLMFDLYHSVKPHVQAGKLKVIAVAARERLPEARQYPLIVDTLAGFSVGSQFGLIAPAATPRAIVRRIQADTSKALNEPEVKAKLGSMGMVVVGSTPEQFDAFVKSEIARWTKVIKDNNIKAD